MDTKLAKTVGAALREARGALHITQEDAAERSGISLEFYARMERGGTLPSTPTLLSLADGLGVSADELLGRGRAKGRGVARRAPSASEERPDVRRLVRRLRGARPQTLRLVALVVAAIERGL
jgi:transcriptional regulator with XRE-family HTH domain